MRKIKWGILSTANIGLKKVIPAMQKGMYCDIVAIASRNKQVAEKEAAELNIPKAYGSYDELLNDPEIDAVYIPLPNNLHVEWATKALNAGKHVLCEKPIGLSSFEAQQLLDAASAKPHLQVMEAFMYRFHPQWLSAKQLVADGRIGRLEHLQSFVSYYNTDPNNIRNKKETGGGGMMDIGCYCISFARFIFGEEPIKAFGHVDIDPITQTDRLASGMLSFSKGTSTFTCSTQMIPYQRVNIIGSEGRIEIDIPVNAPPDAPTHTWLHTKNGTEEFVFDTVDQYTLQGDAFSKSIIEGAPIPTPLKDALNNMKVIEAVFESSNAGQWITL